MYLGVEPPCIKQSLTSVLSTPLLVLRSVQRLLGFFSNGKDKRLYVMSKALNGCQYFLNGWDNQFSRWRFREVENFACFHICCWPYPWLGLRAPLFVDRKNQLNSDETEIHRIIWRKHTHYKILPDIKTRAIKISP